MKIIFHGHSCIELRLDDGTILLVDPWILGNPQSDIDLNFKCDAILVTHGHAHHSGDMITLSQRNQAPIIGMAELVHYAETNGAVPGHPMDLGGQWTFPFGTIKTTHAQHSSSLDIDGLPIYMGEACGFLVMADHQTIYVAGDTSNFGDMALFGSAYHINTAILPIGDNYTMGPNAAASAAKRVKADFVIPVHFNTYPDIRQDPAAFTKLLPDGVVQVLAPGEEFQIPNQH
ncbi:metal-dependent hydrolase [Levilactobacillus bambusae]|uniref:UPF0173 metal-dependent hydrolase DCM90_08925 n=1 Tax=Levilactobacillus bambusae TaxID=2024736 RepID=A0A2V1MZK5_9LACO|nr:metal-dependent hydrolase [Levilactobacillus bambusae]PWF99555.1 metal-dependent hydrolase [Levilactobacillus bambusae]